MCNKKETYPLPKITPTSLTIKNKYGECTISVNKEDMSIGAMIDELIIPTLRAAGYSDSVIEEALRND